MTEKPRYLTVSALNRYIKSLFDNNVHLNTVYIAGEISNFKAHPIGHLYFALKDEKSRINAVMFSSDAKQLKINIEDGMKVLIQARVAVYEATGNYQLYVKTMQIDGLGNLYLQFEQLKEKLIKEGLFDPKYKKDIPTFPKKIGVITASSGAAIHDIITTLEKRYPLAHVYLIPTLVQGMNAKNDIVKNIQIADQQGFDVIILGRGGGSLEDLWPFNEEIVARAIFDCHTPIVSGVGHETDITISDFVADARAATPTAAAVLVTPNIEDLLSMNYQYKQRLLKNQMGILSYNKEKLMNQTQFYLFKNPKKLFEQQKNVYKNLIDRLTHSQQMFIINQVNQISYYQTQLKNKVLTHFQFYENKQEIHSKKIIELRNTLLMKESKNLQTLTSNLKLLNPQNVLQRGYAVIQNEKNHILTKVEDFNHNDLVTILVSDGKVKAKIVKE